MLNSHARAAIILSIILLIVSWVMPLLIAIYFPFGEISQEVKLLGAASVVFYISGLLTAVLLVRERFVSVPQRKYRILASRVVVASGMVALIINVYVYANLGGLPLFNHLLRPEMRELYGGFWAFNYCFLAFGLIVRKDVGRFERFLIDACALFLVLSGMKLILLLLAVSLFVSNASLVANAYKDSIFQSKKILSYSLLITAMFLMSFWARAGSVFNLTYFIDLIYFYIAPSFVNLSNAIESHNTGFNFPFSGVLSAPLSLVGIEVLGGVERGFIEYSTWNVWTALLHLYAAFGRFEVFLAFSLLGYFTYFSFYKLVRSRSWSSQVVFVQLFMTHVFLHNQYYLSSLSAFVLFVFGVAFSSRFRVGPQSR